MKENTQTLKQYNNNMRSHWKKNVAATYVSPGPPAAVTYIHRGRNNITIRTGLVGMQTFCF